MWRSAAGRIMALAQFHDNIIVASTGLGTHNAMRDVCSSLTAIWSLRVLSPCMRKPHDLCTSLCMTQDPQARHMHAQVPWVWFLCRSPICIHDPMDTEIGTAAAVGVDSTRSHSGKPVHKCTVVPKERKPRASE